MAGLTGRMDLCVAGLFGVGKSRAAAVMMVGMLKANRSEGAAGLQRECSCSVLPSAGRKPPTAPGHLLGGWEAGQR